MFLSHVLYHRWLVSQKFGKNQNKKDVQYKAQILRKYIHFENTECVKEKSGSWGSATASVFTSSIVFGALFSLCGWQQRVTV